MFVFVFFFYVLIFFSSWIFTVVIMVENIYWCVCVGFSFLMTFEILVIGAVEVEQWWMINFFNLFFDEFNYAIGWYDVRKICWNTSNEVHIFWI